jgi:hypothetical protein
LGEKENLFMSFTRKGAYATACQVWAYAKNEAKPAAAVRRIRVAGISSNEKNVEM